MGFWHEQSRPDRDLYVTILDENVNDTLPYINQFQKHKYSEVDSLGVGYDYNALSNRYILKVSYLPNN